VSIISSKLINLTGQIIKGWKILEKTKTGKQTAWVCECTCDTDNKRTKVLISSKLRSGNVAKCDCLIDRSKCEICGDKIHSVYYRKAFNMVLCTKHNNQMKKYGKVTDSIIRTSYDKNEIICFYDYALINLYDSNYEKVDEAIIDIDDIEYVSKYKWYLQKSGRYAIAHIGGGLSILLHKFITNTNKDIIVDHRNCNKLDCRRSNLRIADKSKNSQNREAPSNNTSGFTGVTWNKNRNKWYTSITLDKERIYLGCYSKLQDAAISRIRAEVKYFKEFKNKYNENKFIELFNKNPLD